MSGGNEGFSVFTLDFGFFTWVVERVYKFTLQTRGPLSLRNGPQGLRVTLNDYEDPTSGWRVKVRL